MARPLPVVLRVVFRVFFPVVLNLVALSALSVSLCHAQAAAAQENFIATHYSKYEFRIAMRDGVKLFTAVYIPHSGDFKDAGPYPFLMTRTPYSCGPYGEDKFATSVTGYDPSLVESGYLFVCQDVRGRYQSEGTFTEMQPHIDNKTGTQTDDSSDMYDTVEFLLHHVANNNGKVGITGISYPGFFTSASIIDSHPAIKAASPQAPMTNLFLGADDAYHGGAFMLGASFGFYSSFTPQKSPTLPSTSRPEGFDFGTPDTYAFYLHAGNLADLNAMLTKDGKESLFTDQINHNTYDSYWKPRNLAPHMKNIHAAVMTVGGWFDAEDLTGPLQTYKAIEAMNPGIANTVVIGPWTHGGWARTDGDHLGDVQFNAKTAEYFRKQIQFPFFEHYLKEKDSKPLPKAYVFETGTNAWRSYDAWPPKPVQAKMLYFHSNGKLSFEAPTQKDSKDEYVADPAHPVPFVGYPTDTVPQRYMADDQRFAATRSDVLVYQTEPLTDDLTVAGPISPKLHIASTGTDADFVVKLIDVYPADYPGQPTDAAIGKRIVSAPPVLMGSYQQLLRGEPFRAKFRTSWEHPTALKPGEMTDINFSMPDIHHTFRRGHRIMVQVQSSWFPLTDRNPQTFTEIPTAKPEQFIKATQTIYHSTTAPSGVEVLVLPQP